MASMHATINDEEISIYPFDDVYSLLDRYSAQKEGTLPSYFALDNLDFLIEDGLELQVTNVRKDVSTLSVVSLLNPARVNTVLSRYPRLKQRDIFILWGRDKPRETL